MGVTARYRGADKSLARPTSRCILFDGENIAFDVSLVIQGGAKRTHVFQIIVTLFIFNLKKLCQRQNNL